MSKGNSQNPSILECVDWGEVLISDGAMVFDRGPRGFFTMMGVTEY